MKMFLTLLLTPLLVWGDNLPTETFIDEYDESDLTHGENLARITFADKYVYVTHEGHDEETALRNMPTVSGDILETRHLSYSEIEFIDGTLMQIGEATSVEFQAINEIYDNESLSVIKLHRGSVFLHVTDGWQNADRRVFRIDSSSGSAYIEAPGIYRVDMKGSRMTLKTFRGFAELSGETDSTAVYSGEYSTVRHLLRPARARSFNAFHGDRFERWAYDRRPVTESVSANYVDSSIASYSRDLDDHGEWRYESGLNTKVWVPYVTNSWRPYHHGYWGNRSGSLTWISYDSFGWVTHHYGRWGWNLGLGWYWIPGYRYSPAWVAWTNYDSYIGWCPLGYWNRPYYYYRNQPSVKIVSNHYYRWNYVDSVAITNRRRSYTHRTVTVKGARTITTRRIHVTREAANNPTRLTRTIREPEVNRSYARQTATRRGTLVSASSRRDDARSVRIESRNSGTRAVSRHSASSRSNTNPSSSRSATVRQNQPSSRVNSDRNRSRRSESGLSSSRAPENTPVLRSGSRGSQTTQASESKSQRTIKRNDSSNRDTNTRANRPSTSRNRAPQNNESRSNQQRSPERKPAARTQKPNRQQINRSSRSGGRTGTPTAKPSSTRTKPSSTRTKPSSARTKPPRNSSSRSGGATTSGSSRPQRSTPPPRASSPPKRAPSTSKRSAPAKTRSSKTPSRSSKSSSRRQ